MLCDAMWLSELTSGVSLQGSRGDLKSIQSVQYIFEVFISNQQSTGCGLYSL